MKKLTLLSLLFLTLFACRNNQDETISTEVSENQPDITIVDYDPEVRAVTATLFGLVADENGNPMPNAAVKLDNNTTTTDDKGLFLFKEITMNGAGTYVQVNRNGYFNGSDRFFPKEGSVNYSSIIMLERSNTGSFVSSQGGLIESQEGISLDFPAGSIVKANGETYEGTVEVSARWIDPTADNLSEIMPGGLEGINTDAEEVAIASFGMMAVELESDAGEALNLGNDLKATLSFPVPAELLANAPAEIPLWYFSETYGIWVQEGSATLQGDKYVGDVAHFSFWNCDYPYPLVELSGTVVTASGVPVVDAWVSLTMTDGTTRGAITDNDGFFSGKVPQDETFVMEVSQYYDCEIMFTDNIGPFSVDTDLGNIEINPVDLLEISGTITNCAGDPVTNGWVEITIGSKNFNYYVLDGVIDMATNNCDNVTELTILAIDIEELTEGDLMTYTITNPLDLGIVSACGNALSEFFIIELDDVTTTFIDVSMSINVGLDSTFLWASNDIGMTDSNVSLSFGDIPAVGTYTGDIVVGANMFLPGTISDYYSMQCYDPSGMGACGITEVVITTLGNIGEEVTGTITGESEFSDNTGSTVMLPYTASFKVIRN